MKYIGILLFMFNLSAQTTIRPCIDTQAKELTQLLSAQKDTLILKSVYVIESVTITGRRHREHHVTGIKSVKLPLKDIPLGTYTVIVVVNRKMITLNIAKQ